jgi:GNAT superfamily N-acetyltransferase
MITIRDAERRDAEAIKDIFEATYGHDYPYAQFYDVEGITRLIYSEHQVMLVAEDTNTGRVVGTASVVLDIGAMSDLVAEFGRLAVSPAARNAGVGRLLMDERLRRVRERLHVGLLDARLAHPYSLRIAESSGFAPVGLLPVQMRLGRPESFCLLAQHFGEALGLRRNHPRVIPEAAPLAQLALEHCGLPQDVVVDDASSSYPSRQDLTVRELTTEGYAALVRIERGRVRHREIFGPLQLHQGLFKLRTERSHYLLALQDGRVVGAIGWNQSPVDGVVRIFELIALDDGVGRGLLDTLERRTRAAGVAPIMEVDVSAHAPRMQRTLLELGFLPCAYIPAMVFSDVERLDIVRMARLFVPPAFEAATVSPRVRAIVDLVLPPFRRGHVLPQVERAVTSLPIFDGLDADQVRHVASACHTADFDAGRAILQEGGDDRTLFVLLDGTVAVTRGTQGQYVGDVRAGECLGEMSLLTGQPHSATARAVVQTKTATLTHAAFSDLVRRRPDIGLRVFRNLAVGLGAKLGRT